MVAPNGFGGVQIAHYRQLSLTSRPDSPGVTEPAVVLGRGQARAPDPLRRTKLPARFRPRPMTDSPALHPLHSISLQFRRSPVRLAPAFPFHCVPTAANCRDSQENNRARPKFQDSRGRDAPHIGQTAITHESLLAGKPPQYGARLRLSPRTSNRAARLRPAKASAITVSTASFHSALLPETVRPHW